ncbi:hypothetical protein ES703_94391 [subsurface metagenome]
MPAVPKLIDSSPRFDLSLLLRHDTPRALPDAATRGEAEAEIHPGVKAIVGDDVLYLAWELSFQVNPRAADNCSIGNASSPLRMPCKNT